MKKQNFKNHVRYYPFHHFILTPLTLIYLGWTIYNWDFSTSQGLWDGVYNLIGAIILVLLPFLARIYALNLQNRIILGEIRMRYFHLTGESFEKLENQLKMGQIVALRFASDSELLGLIEKAISKKLSPKDIKSSIQDWKGDYRRV
ncbi:hypothetical protein DFQ04_0977 [Algoriphagus boseongensis]|uniref:Uncharacterized protein n=1 Tax=Algoriphagus boseongensis TaxID=1442587 RepID=A0A4R6T7Z8_9BACT|nr:DUF6526 family protein [Algoriphagus boseongensis]TDQ19160.1 hypothetical protein DFQ04_0977 [Algoriphagus boseongensis]